MFVQEVQHETTLWWVCCYMKSFSYYCPSFYQHYYYVKAFVDFCDFVIVENPFSILLLFENLLTFICKNIYCFCFYVKICFFSYLHLNCTITHKLCLHHCCCFIYFVISKFFVLFWIVFFNVHPTQSSQLNECVFY